MTTVFILIDWFHPAYKAGGPVQSIANMVDQFKENIHYKIFCSDKDLDGTHLDVTTDSWIKYNDVTDVWYASNKTLRIKVMQREIENSKADVLFINGIYSWNFNAKPLLFCKAKRKIISVRGMLHPGALSQKKWKKKIYLSVWKLVRIPLKVEFHVSTQEEKNYVQNTFGENIKVHVAANFPRKFSKQIGNDKKANQLNLISVALISPMKNYLPVIAALQNCSAQIHYHIYGPVKDEFYWNQCKEEIKKLPSNISVQYHGDVSPMKVEAALSNGDVFILPSKSENFGHAIYEALSAGKPVITSKNVPWVDLQANKAGINIGLDDQGELINAINFFSTMNNAEMEEWSEHAKSYSEKKIDVSMIRNEYRQMFLAPA